MNEKKKTIIRKLNVYGLWVWGKRGDLKNLEKKISKKNLLLQTLFPYSNRPNCSKKIGDIYIANDRLVSNKFTEIDSVPSENFRYDSVELFKSYANLFDIIYETSCFHRRMMSVLLVPKLTKKTLNSAVIRICSPLFFLPRLGCHHWGARPPLRRG